MVIKFYISEKNQSLHPQSDEMRSFHDLKDQPLGNRRHRCCHSLAPRHGTLAAAPSVFAQRAQRLQRCSAAAGAGEGGLRHRLRWLIWVLEMGVSENGVPHCTQWFCWSLSLWKMAISLGIYPIFRQTQMDQSWPNVSRCLKISQDDQDVCLGLPHQTELYWLWTVYHES